MFAKTRPLDGISVAFKAGGGGVAVRNFEIDHRSSEHPLSAASLRNSKMAYS